jgi:predicted metal-binding transcription factor (methanogenesis marker protein 9)
MSDERDDCGNVKKPKVIRWSNIDRISFSSNDYAEYRRQRESYKGL